MNKKCTNSSCRKTFSTLFFSGNCPYCGKEYPQLVCTVKHPYFRTVRILDFYEQKVRTIKLIRDFFHIGLREAKAASDRIPHTVFVLEREEAVQFVQALQKLGCSCRLGGLTKKTDSRQILFDP